MDPTSATRPKPRHSSVEHSPSTSRVLVLDDNPGIIALYQEVLVHDGLALDVAHTSPSLDEIRRLHPDLILLECRLAGADGCTLLRQIRQDAELGFVPCILITGMLRRVSEMAEELEKLDVPVIAKPFDLDTLTQLVRTTLESASVTPWTPEPSPGALTPQEVARWHDQCVSALWRGDDVQDIMNWMEAHWNIHAPKEPSTLPDAVSFLGVDGTGGGMRWYQRGRFNCGYPAAARNGCYQILTTATLPEVK